MAFRGHYDYSLDAKKRLNVPPRFRAAFSGGVVLVEALEPCVALYPPAGFEDFTERVLGNRNPLSPEYRNLARRFVGRSFDTELDAAGRITLNQSLLDYAGIDKEVVVVGALDHLEVWDRSAWRADQERLNAEVQRIAEGLGDPS
jgi:MraZ protein